MVTFIQKAHGCIFFVCYAIEVQAAQLAISDSCSMLQEQRWDNQGQAVQVYEVEREKETYPLPGSKENPIIQVDDDRNCYPTSFKFLSLALISKNHKKVLPGTSLFHPEASVNQPNQVKPTLLSLLFWNGLSGVSCFHFWRAIPLARIFGGECSPTTLVAVTTLYFSSRHYRQSLVLTLL
jgi:hypothetical protein